MGVRDRRRVVLSCHVALFELWGACPEIVDGEGLLRVPAHDRIVPREPVIASDRPVGLRFGLPADGLSIILCLKHGRVPKVGERIKAVLYGDRRRVQPV